METVPDRDVLESGTAHLTRLLRAIDSAGGRLDIQQFRRLTRETGFPHEGISGLFRGRRPLLLRRANEVELLQRGREAAAELRKQGA